ncbi:hypothetical protein AmaxDRAFT_3958 [Limnospira maxima CS-328]|uniref:Transposase Synechocystis PCC 6803 domain-containing protein n=1 Tax=Limnospira maxima CS-328 TaxID=513049 RepID=B5W5A9_LIMMA|nr:hypothetical protein AmaxDRAFT_3958 [Limnospira maxima CS-328]
MLYDLRQKVIDAIELDGMPKTEASQVFHVSRNTINLWLQRKAQTGDFLPKPHHRPGNNHKITDWQKFKAFAQEHGDKQQLKWLNFGMTTSLLAPYPEP